MNARGFYRADVSTGAPHHPPSRRTLWEEGRRPARLVVLAAGVLLLAVVLLDRLAFGHLTLFFDVAFVLLCTAAALAVRPRDFFAVGVLPPLLMAATMAVLGVWSRGTAADPTDGFAQALVTGLAHHAGALVAGYGLTLAVLALRQVALRNAGAIRSRAHARPQRPSAAHRTSTGHGPATRIPASVGQQRGTDSPSETHDAH
jgi:hypothetical protein